MCTKVSYLAGEKQEKEVIFATSKTKGSEMCLGSEVGAAGSGMGT